MTNKNINYTHLFLRFLKYHRVYSPYITALKKSDELLAKEILCAFTSINKYDDPLLKLGMYKKDFYILEELISKPINWPQTPLKFKWVEIHRQWLKVFRRAEREREIRCLICGDDEKINIDLDAWVALLTALLILSVLLIVINITCNYPINPIVGNLLALFLFVNSIIVIYYHNKEKDGKNKSR